MITFVTGKPGDGKSLYGMKLIVDTLLNSDRVIATNIAVKLPELRAYLILKGWKPKPGHDIAERVITLDNDEVFEFYRHRSGGYVLPPSPDWTQAREGEDADGMKIKKMSRYKFLRHMTEQMREMKKHPRALQAVEYHIDEAHDYFSAREWTDTGRGILWYASKHRHLHDEIILYTQVMKNVEAQLRGLASFTIRARNQLRMRWGPFRKAPIFRLYHYYGGPEDTDKCAPFDTGVMQLDRAGLCQTYKTTGALSVHSKPEEVTNKAPLPYWALPVAAGVLIMLVCGLMAGMPLLAGRVARSKLKATTAEASSSVGIKAVDTKAQPAAFVPVVVEAPDNTTRLTSRAAFQKPFRVAPDVELPDASRVSGVMTVGTSLLVHVEGQEWSPVRMDLGGGLLELASGVVVRRSDVINPRKVVPVKKEPVRTSYASEGRLGYSP